MKKILVVEDEKPLARVLDLKLSAAGFGVTVVYNGEEALAILSRESFDLILLDLVMPKKDGFSVLADLQKAGFKTPVIVSSSLSQREDVEKAKQLGVVDYFVKSDTTLVDLVRKIEQYLQS